MFLNLNLDIAKKLSSDWKYEVLTSFGTLIVSLVKNGHVKQDFNLFGSFETLQKMLRKKAMLVRIILM